MRQLFEGVGVPEERQEAIGRTEAGGFDEIFGGKAHDETGTAGDGSVYGHGHNWNGSVGSRLCVHWDRERRANFFWNCTQRGEKDGRFENGVKQEQVPRM